MIALCPDLSQRVRVNKRYSIVVDGISINLAKSVDTVKPHGHTRSLTSER